MDDFMLNVEELPRWKPSPGLVTDAFIAAETKKHQANCPYLRAQRCPVSIECEHGWDVCPICDPCTCAEKGS